MQPKLLEPPILLSHLRRPRRPARHAGQHERWVRERARGAGPAGIGRCNVAAPRSRPSLRGAEATPRRHLRGSDRRVLHHDDFTETVVDNQWLVLLGILLLMGSRSAWNYCLGRINSDLYVIEIKSFEALCSTSS